MSLTPSQGEPLVSVILCTYDQGEFIADAVESVLAQTYRRVELLLIDNGSRDRTGEIIRRYASMPNVRLLPHPDNGPVTKRLNEGIATSSGSFVSFLFGDDYYLPTKIERQLSCFAALGAEYGVVYGPGYRENVRTNTRWLPATYSRSGLIGRDLLVHFQSAALIPIAPLIRRDCFDTHHLDEETFHAMLEGFLSRLALSYHFYYLDEPLVVMREHPANAGKAYRANTEATLDFLDRLADDPAFPEDLAPHLVTLRAEALRNLAWWMLRLKGDGAEARRYFADAVRIQARQALHPRTFAGLALSVLPAPALGALNRIATLVRKPKSGFEVREGEF